MNPNQHAYVNHRGTLTPKSDYHRQEGSSDVSLSNIRNIDRTGVTGVSGKINEIMDRFSSSGGTIRIDEGTYRIATDTTIGSANVRVEVAEGGIFLIDNGVTLTIGGAFEAGSHPCFSGSGTVSFAEAPIVAYPQWWGAAGDSTTDDTAAFSAMIASLLTVGGRIFVPEAFYRIDSLNFSGAQNLLFEGAGMGKTVFRTRSVGGTLQGHTLTNSTETGKLCFMLLNDGDGTTGGSHPTQVAGCIFKNFSIDGDQQALQSGITRALDYGVYADNVVDTRFEKVEIYRLNGGNGFESCFKLNYSWINYFDNCQFRNYTSRGFETTINNLNIIHLRGCRITTHSTAPANTVGLYLAGGNDLVVDNCDMESDHLTFFGCKVIGGRNYTFQHCYFEGASSSIALEYGEQNPTSVTLINNFFGMRVRAGSNPATMFPSNLIAIGNHFSGSDATFEINALGGVISGNYFEGGGSASFGNVWQGVYEEWGGSIESGRADTGRLYLGAFSYKQHTRWSTLATGSPGTRLFTNMGNGFTFTLMICQRYGAADVRRDLIHGSVDQSDNLLYDLVYTPSGTKTIPGLTLEFDATAKELRAYATGAGLGSAWIEVTDYG